MRNGVDCSGGSRVPNDGAGRSGLRAAPGSSGDSGAARLTIFLGSFVVGMGRCCGAAGRV
jgi:hypothetical protein